MTRTTKYKELREQMRKESEEIKKKLTILELELTTYELFDNFREGLKIEK